MAEHRDNPAGPADRPDRIPGELDRCNHQHGAACQGGDACRSLYADVAPGEWTGTTEIRVLGLTDEIALLRVLIRDNVTDPALVRRLVSTLVLAVQAERRLHQDAAEDLATRVQRFLDEMHADATQQSEQTKLQEEKS